MNAKRYTHQHGSALADDAVNFRGLFAGGLNARTAAVPPRISSSKCMFSPESPALSLRISYATSVF